ncbi:MAG: hypothetical protein IT425_10445 [Pirellulales bacterium]|nr:hypothetical protein [Pirellulales bacterium]
MRTCYTRLSSATSASYSCSCTRRYGTCFAIIVSLVVMLFGLSSNVCAQNVAAAPVPTDTYDPSAPPISQSGNVSFFSQDLGALLRLRYNTESYGQDGQGNFDIGTMQVITMDDSAAIFDGQVTMNDQDGVGFNVGTGYRWMNFPSYAMDTGRVNGIAIFADGTHTNAGNFFPQIGLTYESLGEMWDVRSNLNIPLGPQDQVGKFKKTGEIGFYEHSIAELTRAIVDSSYMVGEVEVARRLGTQRDAWGFAGPYFLTNDDNDSAGFRAGLRGYAFPDLLLQIAVSNDDIFDTYATFSLQWFVGRTRTNFQPACGVPDRMREPFMRNDYVALGRSTRHGGIPLTQTDGSELRIVHFDSTAAAGGDGTFENPYNELNLANGAGSQEGDILFAHSGTTFGTGITLQDNQRMLGEGNDLVFTVDTLQEGKIDIPESAPGARSLARPNITGVAGDAITLADNNEVANFTIDGTGITDRAITSPAGGAGNPNLHHLAISNTTGSGIAFDPATITDSDDLDSDGNTTEQFVRGNVTIDEVTFDNIGGDDIDINSFTATDITAPGVTLQETIAISNVDSTNGNGAGLWLLNTHSTGTASISNYTNGTATAGSGGGVVGQGVLRFESLEGDVAITNADIQNNIGYAFDFVDIETTTAVTLGTNSSYDGGAGAAGGLRADNFDGTLTASNTTFTGGTLEGVSLLGDSDGTFNFASTVTFEDITGTAFAINGDVAGTDSFGGDVTVGGTIMNTTGRSVSVENITTGSQIAFNGNVTDSGDGILVNSNSAGSVAFAGDLAMTIDTVGGTAINVTNNTGATIDIANDVTITATNNANGLVATGGGTLSMPGTVNSISTETGQAVQIKDMTIASAGVVIDDVNRSASAATNAIQLETNTGGPIAIGNSTDSAGDAGTIAGGTVDAVRVVNSANVSLNGLRINNTNAVAGVHVEKTNTAAMTLNLSDLEINDGTFGIETVGGGTGALTMTVNDTTINDSTDHAMEFDNVDTGSITANAVIMDGNNVNGTAGGVLLTGSNASFTFNSATRIREFGGDDFEISGGTGTVSFAGGIENSTVANASDTTGRSVHIHDATGGTITFTAASTINDDNEGMLVEDNNATTINFLGTNTLNIASGNAVTLNNNDALGSNSTITFAGLDITTTGSAQGFVATGGGSLSVTGLTNEIDTENGMGLQIEDMAIGSVDFNEITVDGGTGPANAIRLVNLTGGQVAIGPSSGAVGAGGKLTSTDDAIVLQNVQNVDIRQVQIVSGGNGAGDHGIQISHTAGTTAAMDITIDGLQVDAAFSDAINVAAASTNTFALRLTDSTLANNVAMDLSGSGHFGLLVDNTDINATGTEVAFSLIQSGSATNADVTFRNGNAFTAVNATALLIDSAGASGKTFNLSVQDSTFSNNSAGNAAASITAEQTSLMNATIQGNTFLNSNGAGQNFDIVSDGASAFMRLSLGGTGADANLASGGTGNFDLHELNSSDFDVFEKTDTFGNLKNTGTIVTDPGDAAFDDLPTAPTLPTVP